MHEETQEEKPLFTGVIMSLLLSLLALAALLGNGFILAVIGRFKSLQTVPNILIANLAAVDLLSAAITVPVHILSNAWEASWLSGKILEIISSSLNRFFLMLNLVSMLTIMTNMYLGISFGLRYLAWKTKTKALICVFLIWFTCIVVAISFAFPLLDVNISDAHLSEYREEIFEQTKYFVAAGTSILLICGALVSFLTTYAMKRERMKREEMHLPSAQNEARLRVDVKATKTIAIIIAAYVFCFIPSIVFAAVIYKEKTIKCYDWFTFIALYSIEFSSTVNPIIYFTRTRRCRSAFKQLLKNPFGSGDYKERPNINQSSVLKGTKDGVEHRHGLSLKMDGNSTGEAYVGKQRNAMAVLSFESANAGIYNAYGKQLSRVGQRSKCRVQALDTISEEETRGGHGELDKTRREKIEERLHSSSGVHPHEVVVIHTEAEDSDEAERKESAHHFRRKEKRQALSRKSIATVSSSLVLPTELRKAAWQVPEKKTVLTLSELN